MSFTNSETLCRDHDCDFNELVASVSVAKGIRFHDFNYRNEAATSRVRNQTGYAAIARACSSRTSFHRSETHIHIASAAVVGLHQSWQDHAGAAALKTMKLNDTAACVQLATLRHQERYISALFFARSALINTVPRNLQTLIIIAENSHCTIFNVIIMICSRKINLESS